MEILAMPTSSKTTITKALSAARRGDSDAVLRLASTLPADEPAGASADELWVRAEAAYQRGEYTDAMRLFSAFERHGGAKRAPAWQRYGSTHRRCFILHQQGRYVEMGKALEELQRFLRDHPVLAEHGADVEALMAHRFEMEGDYERARARMLEAHRRATEAENWGRAATTASDVGRITAILPRPDPDGALEWQAHARELALRINAPRLVRTFDERRASILKTLGRYDEAGAIYEEVIAGCLKEPMPATLEAAYMGRADLRVARGDLAGAESDFRAALAIAEQAGMKRMMIYPLKDLARLHLERGGNGDLERARDYFARAMGLIVSLEPPQPILYRQLAEDVLRDPRYLSKPLRTVPREKLEKSLRRLVELTGPHPYQHAFRVKDFERAVTDLVLQLRNLQEPEIRLANCLVRPQSGTVLHLKSGEIRKIQRAQVQLLHYLVDRTMNGRTGVPSVDIKHDLKMAGDNLTAIQKRLDRLGEAIGEDLVMKFRGKSRPVYSVRVHELTIR
jgi:tetratricopeptide (TPR) repeat protein